MKKNIKKLFLAAGLLAITGALLTGCGSKKKNAEEESVIKISTAPEPTATPDPKTVDPDAVTSNGNLTMVNEYLAENGSEALGIDGVTPTPAASDGSTDNADVPVKIQAPMRIMIHQVVVERKEPWMENEAKKPLELYIHIPFCVKKCDYCDFLSGPAGKERQREYFQALEREIAAVPDFSDREITTVFIGGGTPSVPDPSLVGEMLDQIRNKFFVAPDAEITIEANPGTLYKEKLQIYLEHGINRLSLGLQSPQNRELKILGRIHTWEEFQESFFMARDAGFSNINIDLMSAIPEQTYADWEKNLRTVAGLSPEHISAYSLIIEEGTPFGERKLKLPDEDTEYRMYENTAGILEEYGFHQYEISNYAKGGRECRHNKGYWQRIDYLGLGLGASSLLEHMRFSNTADMKEYIGNSAFPDKIRQNMESLTEADEMAEFMFLGLRMTEGVSMEAFAKYFGKNMENVYGEVLKKHLEIGMLEQKGDRIYLSRKGIHVSNGVMADFLL